MFSLPGVLAQSTSLVAPSSTILYLRGDSLTDSSVYSRAIAGHTHAENAITFDTSDSIYGSNASMLFPFVTSSWIKYSAKIESVSLGNAPWTIEMWYKRLRTSGANPAASDIFTYLQSNYNGVSIAGQQYLSSFAGNLNYWERNKFSRILTITANVWTHIAICRQSGSNFLRIFINGTQVYGFAYSNDLSVFTTLVLGANIANTVTAPAVNYFKLAHFHLATECYYSANFTPNKATGFS